MVSIQAEYNGQWEKIQVLHEQIKIKKQKPVTEEVLITRHGPIINAASPRFLRGAAARPALDRPGTRHDDQRSISPLSKPRIANNFMKPLKLWTSPAQNVVYADIDGNIGYTFAGKVPIRAKNRGRLPVPGWTDEYEWTGYIPFECLPHIENPAQGFIVTANNRIVSEDYPVQLDLEPISWRSRPKDLGNDSG